MLNEENTTIVSEEVIGQEVALPESIMLDPDLTLYYKNLSCRIIYLENDFVEWNTVQSLIKQIILWNEEDEYFNVPLEERQPIKLFIFNFGGDVSSALSLYSIIRASKTKIITVNLGASMSSGLIILLSGHERYALKYSNALIHEGESTIGGTISQNRSLMNLVEKMTEMTSEIVLERTKITAKLYNKQKEKEWYIFDKEQEELGIVDKMVNSLEEII